jgi:hypothetical protein
MFTARRRRIGMRKLNALLRSLHTFLADPSGHLTTSWALIRNAAVDSPRNTTPAFRDALVLVDNVVEAVAGFLRKDSEEQDPEPAPKS